MSAVDRRVNVVRLLAWQGLWVAALLLAMGATGRGSARGIMGGAVLLAASLILQVWATRAALARRARPGLAVGLFTLKLALLLGIAAIGLRGAALAPMSFAAGATTLLLAIVVEACYVGWSSRPRRLARAS